MDKLIYGGDTETVAGLPNTLQMHSEDVSCDEIFFVTKKDSFKTFLKWCGSLKTRYEHVMYIHNLAFDLPEFFYGHHELLASGDFDFDFCGWHIEGVYGTPTFARLTKGLHTITLVDSYSFYRGSLLSASALYCPDLPKLARPRDLGKVRITPRDKSKIKYAMRDAVVAYHIGKGIEAIHQEFDVRQAVSVADLSAKIFRKQFLNYTIPQPNKEIVRASMAAYHGGKNGITAKPGWHLGVTSIDISSAYPKAMADMPAFENGNLYRKYNAKGSGVRSVPRYGVYCISGTVKDCDYPCLFDDGFKTLKGRVTDQWVHGFDLNEALRNSEIKVTKIRGHYYDAERDHGAPALRGFVNDFYTRKQSEPDRVRRYMYKTILNSLYGKFIQTRKRNLSTVVSVDSEDVGEAGDLVAGGLFHPFIASGITADCRARIHRLEHHWKALHTATDSVFTQKSVVDKKGARNFDLHPGQKALGAMDRECHGDLLLIRNKCYIIYSNRNSGKLPPDCFESRTFPGKMIIKRAMHGFQGTVFDLEQLIATGRRSYQYTHANKLKESVRRGLQVNDFIERTGTLKVGPIRVQR